MSYTLTLILKNLKNKKSKVHLKFGAYAQCDKPLNFNITCMKFGTSAQFEMLNRNRVSDLGGSKCSSA